MISTVARLAAACQLMALARVAHELDCLLAPAQDSKQLLGLADRHAIVLFAVQYPQRRRDLVGVRERRVLPEFLLQTPGIAVELKWDQLVGIAGARLGEQIIHAARGHGAGKAVTMRDQPGSHVAAVRAASHSNASRVDPAAGDRRVDA